MPENIGPVIISNLAIASSLFSNDLSYFSTGIIFGKWPYLLINAYTGAMVFRGFAVYPALLYT
ncbi:MAG: hypothetical protein A3B99_05205 [Candidatus Yanofskybacteria bacterium RIFCSPHIGHO2_02_FULL_44_12b]|nr:MAG: hypothetical protein A2659_02450 [Candidatus Yanofskybacteria bacterium RIFCSPHIGHO2_01_FULL_44_24]OGN16488.1 MAG: hypothetical protein A3B99_05205 [Candidatus Yanofskybacteria bacterium RIFCSPHIGHO2_02_FULL_44_12b]